MNMSPAAELANQMGVSEVDVMCLAQSVANSLLKDKMNAEAMKKLAPENQTELIEVYIEVANKKMSDFVVKYQTQPAAREAFSTDIYLRLKGE